MISAKTAASAARGGAGVDGSGLTVTNSGTITGGNGGTGDETGGAGGPGIEGAGVTIMNSGTITGGMNGDGVTRGDAIEFTDTSALASTLEITSTSSISGNVVDTGGTYNFVLGDTTNGSFNTSLLGTQYQDVGKFQLNAGNAAAVWTLTGTNAYTGSVEITQGILNVTVGALNSASALTLDGGTLQAGGALTVSNATTLGTGTISTLDPAGNALTYSGTIGGPGGLVIAGTGVVTFSGAHTYTGTTLIQTGGTLVGGAANTFSTASAITIDPAGTLDLNFNQTIGSLAGSGNVTLSAALTTGNDDTNTAFSGSISGSGGLTKIGTGTFTLSGNNNSYAGATNADDGTLEANSANAFSADSLTTAATGATLDFGGFAQTIHSVLLAGGTVKNGALTGAISSAGGTVNGIGGIASLTTTAGTTDLLGTNSYTGATTVDGGTLEANSANAFSADSLTSVATGATLDLGNFAQTINSVSLAGGTIQNGALTGAISSAGGTVDNIGGSATLTTSAGTTDVLGTNAYTGATTVDGGTLDVIGAITASSDVTVNGGTLNVTGSVADPTVNAGGTLTGTGAVGDTTINTGGFFAPGTIGTPSTSETVKGNLTLASGSTYQIYLNPTTSSLAHVSGSAALGGTVAANFINGSYISKTYTILTTTGGVSSTFSGVTNVNLPSNFTDKLSYDAKNTYLDLTLNFPPPPPPPTPGGNPQSLAGLNRNQLAVANTLVNYFNKNGGIPTKFGALPGAALSQINGEGNTGAEHSAFQLETEFLNAMLDPFVDGRFGNDGAPNSASGNNAQPLGYTAEELFMPRAMASAYGPILKGPPPAVYVPHWTAWGRRLRRG